MCDYSQNFDEDARTRCLLRCSVGSRLRTRQSSTHWHEGCGSNTSNPNECVSLHRLSGKFIHQRKAPGSASD